MNVSTIARGLVCCVLSSAPIAGFCLPAPLYLSVPHFKNCLGNRVMGTWRSLCLPEARPPSCPSASWTKLKELPKGEALSLCPYRSSPSSSTSKSADHR
jgi:hypothetical protein